MDLKKLIDLNRGEEISLSRNPHAANIHSVIFKASTLDFWLATDSPPATKGKWIGFNLRKELHSIGNDPSPIVIPDESNVSKL